LTVGQIRVGIVNDMRLAAEVLRRIVSADAAMTVSWTAADGLEAIDRCRAELPDIVLMDLVMPNLDGVGATRRIMAETPCPILIVTSTVEGNLSLVYEAMGCGALDVVTTPVVGDKPDENDGATLCRKIRSICSLAGSGQAHGRAAVGVSTARTQSSNNGATPPLIAIGASTGGPAAAETILRALPSDLPAAIVLVQHIDTAFVEGFVSWLKSRLRLPIALAKNGDRLRAGQVLVANSDQHLSLQLGGRLAYVDGPPDALYRPSVDVLFHSAAAFAPPDSWGILLTGMGRDGAEGLLAMRRAGLHTIAQNRESSVVFGMPGAATAIGAAELVLPIDRIADHLLSVFQPPSSANALRPI
jgi:two-component system, chemotaxis family, response regulator WspF